ncbi:hypothetical protein PR048_022051 [Dryococelus australis]|uniref:Uncharacterized protein n=1 Tax=Dryococelus australis TaxID=614101 RepID=A0ABQ9H062_9NEOP|nr:hypothetical protein PR048_022051 [Dryococelus australis]
MWSDCGVIGVRVELMLEEVEQLWSDCEGLMQGDKLEEHIEICKGSSTGSQQVMSPIPHAASVGTDPTGDNDETVNAEEGMKAVQGGRNGRSPRKPADQRHRTVRFSHAGPGVTRPGIEPGSPLWEASRLTAQPQLGGPRNPRRASTLCRLDYCTCGLTTPQSPQYTARWRLHKGLPGGKFELALCPSLRPPFIWPPWGNCIYNKPIVRQNSPDNDENFSSANQEQGHPDKIADPTARQNSRILGFDGHRRQAPEPEPEPGEPPCCYVIRPPSWMSLIFHHTPLFNSRRGAPRFSHIGIVRDDVARRWVFSGISISPRPYISGAAPHSLLFTLNGSQDLDVTRTAAELRGREHASEEGGQNLRPDGQEPRRQADAGRVSGGQQGGPAHRAGTVAGRQHHPRSSSGTRPHVARIRLRRAPARTEDSYRTARGPWHSCNLRPAHAPLASQRQASSCRRRGVNGVDTPTSPAHSRCLFGVEGRAQCQETVAAKYTQCGKFMQDDSMRPQWCGGLTARLRGETELDSPAASFTIFACGKRGGRFRWSEALQQSPSHLRSFTAPPPRHFISAVKRFANVSLSKPNPPSIYVLFTIKWALLKTLLEALTFESAEILPCSEPQSADCGFTDGIAGLLLAQKTYGSTQLALLWSTTGTKTFGLPFMAH